MTNLILDKIDWLLIENQYDWCSEFYLYLLIDWKCKKILSFKWNVKYWERYIVANFDDWSSTLKFNNMQNYNINSMKNEWANIFKYNILKKMYENKDIIFSWEWEIFFNLILDISKRKNIYIKQWIVFENAISIIWNYAKWFV